jgi:hypothetical protein
MMNSFQQNNGDGKQNFDDQPLPTSKAKTFEELLAENLGSGDTQQTLDPEFHDTSKFGGEENNDKPKK